MFSPLLRAVACSSLLALMLWACGGVTPPNELQLLPAAGFETGSMNVASADAPLPRPAAQPCVVDLYADKEFRDFSSSSFKYNPVCPGPWAKVILQADFAVNAGRQFDRTGHISLGGVNLYTGTTQEPSAANAASWRIERDVTDYSRLFAQSQEGAVDLDNLVNETYTGVLRGSARLLFYPHEGDSIAPRSADMVIALTDRKDGRPLQLKQGAPEYKHTLQLPRNNLRAYLDVIAQGQADDEFWYACAPDDLAETLQTCPGGGLRQVQVLLDDKPVGLAPIMPWMFTGGISPRLWRPIPGIHALNFQPFRLDLSPLVGILNDGRPHTLALRVQNVRHYFNLSANLLLYRDAQSESIPGRLLENTLSAPQQQLRKQAQGDTLSELQVSSDNSYVLRGEIHTARGRELLEVEQKMRFSNLQKYAGALQVFDQGSTLETSSRVSTAYASSRLQRSYSMPLWLSHRDENGLLDIRMKLGLHAVNRLSWQDNLSWGSQTTHELETTVARTVPGASLSSKAWHRLEQRDTRGACFARLVNAQDAKLQSAQDESACRQPVQDKPWGIQPLEWGDLWLALINQ
ncbi:peptide-N4-asparagine amidase [Massilia sp. W12]|uniref:peptide-N4-asparagine amidase n=1 Tax=Massilia sp. W12 TaxID=3126507 RepID=UPI0030D41890